MTIVQALILGIVQGLTEFLPVSSDGHLVIVQEVFGLRPPNAVAYDVLLHLGTLVAVVAYFWRDLSEMALALIGRGGPDQKTRIYWIFLLGIATVPVAIAGVLFEDWIGETFNSAAIAGVGLLVTGTMLAFIVGRGATGRMPADLTVRDAVLIGSIQTLALLPGVSRSGSTLFGALTIGLERNTAARFSFLLSIPAIVGALVLKAPAVLEMAREGEAAPLIVGPVAAAITGWLAIEVMMRAIRSGSLRGFSVYCWTAGALVLVWSVAGGIGG
ncbi:MAG TPA: undecaprenyl-diphosphate phosphatase [Candidatus Binatia bacterium]|nr:undecaprenyl-diphosphate phosphatase [Candidatus Binatia bacterium]